MVTDCTVILGGDFFKAMLADTIDGLPDSLQSWRHINILRDPQWWQPWELLRPFFLECGYELFNAQPYGEWGEPKTVTPPAIESFGLHGDRNDFRSDFPPVAQVFAARDTKNRDVVIKLISKGYEGNTERKILQLLNSAPLRTDPANPTVPVLEFIEFRDYCFAVMPYCDGCDSRSFFSAFECLDFAEQLLEGLSFLHQHRIAHLDISPENILVNHHGKLPRYEDHTQISPLEWRSTFPVRYSFIDFGYSVHFKKDAPLFKYTVDPFPQGREHRAPETLGRKPFNPFAADIYQTARVFYSLFSDIAHDVPDLLKLLQDMSSYNPARRITATTALVRMRTLRLTISNDKRTRDVLSFPVIPTSNFLIFRDMLECGHWTSAFQFAWKTLKIWLWRTEMTKKMKL